MLAHRYLSAEFEAWNRKWGAPYGYPNAENIRYRDDIPFIHKARLAGPFAFQANNTTRYYEYPWVYDQIDHSSSKTIVDVGAGVTGLQFVLSKIGHRVYCVDPGLASPDQYGWGSQLVTHQDLNSAFHTDVARIPTLLEDCGLQHGTIDVVTCVSTLEHVPFEGSVSMLKAAGDLLKPGGRFIATIDLFLDLEPFTKRTGNKWGTNLDLGKLFETDNRFKLVVGEPSELYGCEGFDPDRILERCAEFYIGEYPLFAQCFVLERLAS
jgi:2-polyprenyl-3-methyl-5-hydroxy-6-metoxy-1,4-benzoquinol methylase